jgi:hypothetical protein
MAYDNTDRVVLFKDDKKVEPEDRDYSGSINIAGAEYWLSAWIKTSKAGKKFLSLSVKPKSGETTTKQSKPDLDDCVPF